MLWLNGHYVLTKKKTSTFVTERYCIKTMSDIKSDFFFSVMVTVENLQANLFKMKNKNEYEQQVKKTVQESC